MQSSYNPFSVAQSGGTVSVTLTSAVETLPGGALLTSVTMGLGIGTISNDTCTLLTNAFTTAQAGSAAQLTGNLNAGAYCVKVSDVSNQFGPVSYASRRHASLTEGPTREPSPEPSDQWG